MKAKGIKKAGGRKRGDGQNWKRHTGKEGSKKEVAYKPLFIISVIANAFFEKKIRV